MATSIYGPLKDHYLQRMKQTIDNALEEYPRTFALRVDLRLPDGINCNEDATIITRFITSVKAQVRADLYRKKKAGKRTYPCRVRYIWVREFGQKGKKHYHVLFLLNKDAYAYPGDYKNLAAEELKLYGGISWMIADGWMRALKRSDKKYHRMVYLPKRGYYHLNRKNGETDPEYQDLLSRVSYMAKEFSKDNSDGQRNFGCSQY
jgi:hypothetical protein